MKEEFSLEYFKKIVEENKKNEEIKAFKFWGLSIGLTFPLFLIFSLLIHHKEFLFVLFVVSLFTFGIAIYSYVDKSFRLGTLFLLCTFIFIATPIVVVVNYDNVKILSVMSREDVKVRYFSLFKTNYYIRPSGDKVELTAGNFIENNTNDTLVLYEITYSSYLTPYHVRYPIVQKIDPNSYEKLLHMPDYIFQSPPQSISVRHKRFESVSTEKRYYLETL